MKPLCCFTIPYPDRQTQARAFSLLFRREKCSKMCSKVAVSIPVRVQGRQFRYRLSANLQRLLLSHQSFRRRKIVIEPRVTRAAPARVRMVWPASGPEIDPRRSIAPSKREISAKSRPGLFSIGFVVELVQADIWADSRYCAPFPKISAKPGASLSSVLRTGFVYDFFISVPQQHLGLE